MFIFLLYIHINNKGSNIQNSSKNGNKKIISKMCTCDRVNNASFTTLEENHL
jgi:hypothetical protein